MDKMDRVKILRAKMESLEIEYKDLEKEHNLLVSRLNVEYKIECAESKIKILEIKIRGYESDMANAMDDFEEGGLDNNRTVQHRAEKDYRAARGDKLYAEQARHELSIEIEGYNKELQNLDKQLQELYESRMFDNEEQKQPQ